MVEAIRVLHVDDEPAFVEVAAKHLERVRDDLTVVTETSGEDGLRRLDEESFDCVVSDYDMPGMGGLSFLDAVRERDPDLPFILFTGKGSEEIASEAISAGVTDYLQKRPSGDQYTVLANRIENAAAQYRAERELTETRKRFSKLVERSTDVVSIVDSDGTYQYVAPSMEEVLGYDPDDLVGTNGLDIVHEDDRERAAEELAAVADEPGAERIVEVRVVDADGETRVLEVKGRNLMDEPSVEGIVLNIRDVTERVTLQERLRNQADVLRRLYEVSTDVELDFETKLDRLLELGTDYVGLSVGYVARVEGETLQAVKTVGDHELVTDDAQAPLSHTYCKRPIDDGDLTVVEDATDEGWADDPAFETFGFQCYLGAPIFFEGEVYGTVCFADTAPRDGDVTDFERSVLSLLAQWVGYELVRQRQAERLDDVETRLEDFASIVSHDLRNPLQVAHGFVSEIEGNDDAVERVETSLGRMDRIIEDGLTMVRHGRRVEETETVALETVAEECWDGVDTADADLVVENDVRLQADSSRLGHLLENLFRNAVQHAGEDVTVRVGEFDRGFYVADDGPGIPEEKRSEVFEAGYSTSHRSTGLGLPIVEYVAEAHGWSVQVVDGRGGGARFEFRTGLE